MADEVVTKIKIETEGADKAAEEFKKLGKASEDTGKQMEKAGETSSKGLEKFATTASSIGEKLGTIGGLLGETKFAELGKSFSDAGESVNQFASTITTARQSFTGLVDSARNVISTLQGLRQGITGVNAAAAATTIGTAMQTAGQGISAFGTKVTALGTSFEKVAGEGNVFSEALKASGGAATTAGNALVDYGKQLGEAAGPIAETAIALRLWAPAITAATTAVGTFAQAWGPVIVGVGAVVAAVASAAEAIIRNWDSIKTAFREGVDWNSVFAGMKDAFLQNLKAMGDEARGFWNSWNKAAAEAAVPGDISQKDFLSRFRGGGDLDAIDFFRRFKGLEPFKADADPFKLMQEETAKAGFSLQKFNTEAGGAVIIMRSLGFATQKVIDLISGRAEVGGAFGDPTQAEILRRDQQELSNSTQQVTQGFITVADAMGRFAPAMIDLGSTLGGVTGSLSQVILELREKARELGGGFGRDPSAWSWARGGLLGGRGTGTSDSNLAWVSRGEYITPAGAVRQPGVLAFLEALRRSGGNLGRVLDGMGRYALGGLVVPSAIPAMAGGGSMHPVTINFAGTTVAGLRASSEVVEELRRAAVLAQVRSGGRKPSRYS